MAHSQAMADPEEQEMKEEEKKKTQVLRWADCNDEEVKENEEEVE